MYNDETFGYHTKSESFNDSNKPPLFQNKSFKKNQKNQRNFIKSVENPIKNPENTNTQVKTTQDESKQEESQGFKMTRKVGDEIVETVYLEFLKPGPQVTVHNYPDQETLLGSKSELGKTQVKYLEHNTGIEANSNTLGNDLKHKETAGLSKSASAHEFKNVLDEPLVSNSLNFDKSVFFNAVHNRQHSLLQNREKIVKNLKSRSKSIIKIKKHK